MGWDPSGPEPLSPAEKKREENYSSHRIKSRTVIVGWGDAEVDFCEVCGVQGYCLGDNLCSGVQAGANEPPRPVWRPPRLSDWPKPSQDAGSRPPGWGW